MVGGSGKRSLPMARGMDENASGKLRGLRLPLPPLLGAFTGAENIGFTQASCA
jgi:hypothetical protein